MNLVQVLNPNTDLDDQYLEIIFNLQPLQKDT